MPDDKEAIRKSVGMSLKAIGQHLIKVHKAAWPAEVDCHYLVIHHKGHTKVRLMPPDIKEQGWKD